jgi:hypothetical protein
MTHVFVWRASGWSGLQTVVTAPLNSIWECCICAAVPLKTVPPPPAAQAAAEAVWAVACAWLRVTLRKRRFGSNAPRALASPALSSISVWRAPLCPLSAWYGALFDACVLDVLCRYAGVMYEHGGGVARDQRRALHWYLCAAQNGLSHAQFLLSELYAHGSGQSDSCIARAFGLLTCDVVLRSALWMGWDGRCRQTVRVVWWTARAPCVGCGAQR